MKRRRFITFGSILAMALSLTTVGYLYWLVMCHAREGHVNLFGTLLKKSTISLASLKLGTADWEVKDYTSWIGVYLTKKGPCNKCAQRHDVKFDCSGAIHRKGPHPGISPRHINAKIGPMRYSIHGGGLLVRYELLLPLWLPILVLAAYPAIYFLVVGIRRNRSGPGHCTKCDYDLTGNESGVCPECGTRMVQVDGK